MKSNLQRSAKVTQSVHRHPLLELLEDRSLLAAQPLGSPFAAGELIVGFDGDLAAEYRTAGPGQALRSAAARLVDFGLQQGVALMHRPAAAGNAERLATLWKLPPGKEVLDVATALSKLPGIAYAEPNYYVSTAATQSLPNDPKFSSLWGMHNTGANGGTVDADIDGPEAWSIHKGTGNVVVAVVDTGFNYKHADLKNNVWTNTGEIPGNGLDDDTNGFVDDVYGFDFVNDDGDPLDDNGHGTHVSGTIGAQGNNGTGVVGVDHNVKIMGLKFLDSAGSGTTDNAIRALDYATKMRRDYGINLVLTSNSWGGGGYSQGLYDAIKASGEAGMLFVAAAGNDYATSASYPALYDLDNIISVAATDRNDRLASFSNRGTGVDIAAPGVDIYSTFNNTYKSLSGTSMATPHVAGAAALVADYVKTNTGALPSYHDVRDAIFNSGDPISATLATISTGRRLNAYGALLHAQVLAGEATGLSIADASVVEGNGGSVLVSLTVTRSGNLDGITTARWATGGGTGTADTDYVAASGDLTFAASETTRQINVTVLGDTSIEPHETFTVVLSEATNMPTSAGVTLLRDSATATILTDDVTVSVGDTTTAEGGQLIGFKGEFISLGTDGAFTPYSMIYGPDGNLYVADISGSRILRYDANGTPLPAPGRSGAEFVPSRSGGLSSARQITFGPDANDDNQFDLYVVSELTDSILRYDGITGADLGVFVASGSGGLSRPRGLLFHTDGYAYVTSVGPDETPAVGRDAILRYNAVTGAPAGLSGAADDAVFVPSSSGSLDNPSVIVFHMVFRPDGLYVTSWRNDSVIRYDATTGDLIEVVVPPGVGGIDSSTSILFEPQGTFLVRGSNGRILRYGPASVAVFTLNLNTAAGVPVAVSYSTADGTAVGDNGSILGDYRPAAGIITFAPGETSKTILIATHDDTDQESVESFSVNITSTDAVVLDGQGIGTGTIIDNDYQAEVVNYSAIGLPKAIPSPGTVTSTINVSDSFTVLDVDVRLDIMHSSDYDLTAYLIGPDGTRVKLFDWVGGTGHDFIGTILDDEATLLISSGTAPFTGRFRPEEMLSVFDGKSGTGTWTLEVSDGPRTNKGKLNGWSLDFSRAGASSASSELASTSEGSLSDRVLSAAAIDQLLIGLQHLETRKSRSSR